MYNNEIHCIIREICFYCSVCFITQISIKSDKLPDWLYGQSEALFVSDVLRLLWTPSWQLPGGIIYPGQDPLHWQRHRSAVCPKQVPRHSVQHVRHRCHEIAGTGRGLDGITSVPPSHDVRLQGPPTRQRPALHRSVRPAYQPVQREDLPVRLVLDGVRCSHHLFQPADVGPAHGLQDRPPSLHQEAPDAYGQAAARPGQETGAKLRREVPEAGWLLCTATDRPQYQCHYSH